MIEVEANPVSQTATVTYDPAETSLEDLRDWVEDCGYHCAGQSVPSTLRSDAGARRAGALRRHRRPHDEMSMADMANDMRNRFLVAVAFSIPIVLWSPIGRDVFGFDAAVPFGLREDVFTLILSLPVIFYSCAIFFTGAVRALRARTLDMMVLVAVAVGAGWLYSVVITLTGGGEVFYEAATVLASSSCSAIGSRCGLAAGPTTRSGPSSTSPRRRRW